MISKSVVCLLRKAFGFSKFTTALVTPRSHFPFRRCMCQTRNVYRFICFSLHSSFSLPLPYRTSHTHLNGIQITVYFGIILYMHINTHTHIECCPIYGFLFPLHKSYFIQNISIVSQSASKQKPKILAF